MRIGEILVESGWIKPAQLTSGLDYSKAKALPIGRVLQILKCVNENQVELALAAQRHIRAGASSTVALAALHKAYELGVPFDAALKEEGDTSSVTAGSAKPAPPAPSTMTVNWAADTMRKLTEAGLSSSVKELVNTADKLALQNHIQEAAHLYRRAIEQSRSSAGGANPESLQLSTKFANFLFAAELFAEAEVVHEEIVESVRSSVQADDPQLSRVLEEFADLCVVAEKYERAASLFLQAIDAIELRLPSALPDYLHAMRKLSKTSKFLPKSNTRPRLGSLLVQANILNENQLQETLNSAKKANKPLGVALQESKLTTPQTLASVMHCQLVLEEGRVPEDLAIRALRLALKQEMPLKSFLAGANIPPREEDSPQYKELALCLDELLALETSGEAQSAKAAGICLRLGQIYWERNSVYDAGFSFKRALDVYKRLAPTTPEAAQASVGVASSLLEQNRLPESHAVLSDALTNCRIAESKESADILRLLSLVEFRQGSSAVALSFGQSALSVMDKVSYANGTEKLTLLETLAHCSIECCNYEGSAKLLERAAQIGRDLYGAQSPELAANLERLGDLYKLASMKDHATGQYYIAQRILFALSDEKSQEAYDRLSQKIASQA